MVKEGTNSKKEETSMNKAILEKTVEEYCHAAVALGLHPLARTARVLSALQMMNTLAGVFSNMEADPYPQLLRTLQHQKQFLEDIALLRPVLDFSASVAYEPKQDEVGATEKLFELAWTTYNQETYEHSISLIDKRLRANGLDEKFFAGKRCFDGGCGTGRFAVAMARMGAQVVGMDIGSQSLEFARDMNKRLGSYNIEYVRGDVTTLTSFADNSFDFVVSNGVLHHAVETERGILEHLRVTVKGGLFWLYLYGDGGIYWQTYDGLRDSLQGISPAEMKDILSKQGIRQGAIYTYLDNLCAPIRKYYTVAGVSHLLSQGAKVDINCLRGVSVIDDVLLMLGSAYGKEVMGPDGEVRLLISKY